ncbi:MAG: YdeI/OmpD-associated family protein [Maribacter sp.]|uniref:YdeI/OmpD-associated family protein n=1 Tax=Maribacter sp. TaxID=1897614 RepID=UPI003C711DBA
MKISEKLEAYFEKEHPHKEGISVLRALAAKTKAEEAFKWSAPVYTLNGKNVFWIARFKSHFGIGFFNGVFLKDPKGILINVNEGKTQAMRHLKFKTLAEIDSKIVVSFMNEALENQKKMIQLVPKKKERPKLILPEQLKQVFVKHPDTKKAFYQLTPYKQREYAEYISSAKQDKTKLARLEKIIPKINAGVGLNDNYRNC